MSASHITTDHVVAAVRGAVVRFGNTTVLHGVDLELRAGEVHALVGQNGAGKSTLVKALTGINRLAEGHVEVDGLEVSLSGPSQARDLGLEIVYQDQPLAAHLTVAENMFLGRERTHSAALLDDATMRRTATDVLKRIGAHFSPDELADDLTPTERVQVSIAAALAAHPSVLVLDEPTAALGAREAEPVFDVIRAARHDGVAVLYISHRLSEITALADRITVLRDGRLIESRPATDVSTDDIITAMVGRELKSLFPEVVRSTGEPVLSVRGLASGDLVRDVTFTVRAGEIVGLAGLVGSGASETLLALFGDRPAHGQVRYGSGNDAPRSSRAGVHRGIALIPQERRRQAVFPDLGVRQNVTAASLRQVKRGGLISRAREREVTTHVMRRLNIVASGTEQSMATLSGGNQQKAIVARWLTRNENLYLVDEPTAGVDVAAKTEIYEHLSELAAAGAGVVIASSDFDELIGLCDRILVLRDGVVTDEFDRGAVDERTLTSRTAAAGTVPAQTAEAGATDTDTDRGVAARTEGPSGRRAHTWPRQIGVGVAMLAVVVALAIGSPGFLFPSGFWDVLRQAGTPALLATALAIALSAGAFDLSIGGVASLTASVSAVLVNRGVPIVAVIVIGVVLGALVGVVNGAVTVTLRVPSFVATLAMLFLLVGITLGVNAGLAVTVPAGDAFLYLGQGQIGPVPAVLITSALVVVGVWLAWQFTRPGLRLRATGDDPQVAALRGIGIARSTITALGTSAALSGLAGVLLASYSSGATARDASLELLVSALAAVFLGSAMTRAFLFNPATAALGSLFVTAVGSGLIANGLSSQWLGGVQGAVLLIAVLVASARRRALGQVAIF